MTKKTYSILTTNAFSLNTAQPPTTFAATAQPDLRRAGATGFSVRERTAPKRVQSFAARRRNK
jgi:hypothetical protein